MAWISFLPNVNAALNGTSALLLTAGYLAIRTGRVDLHKACMLSAVATSVLFLTSYLIYHYHVGSTPFEGQGWVRPAYFTILISHTVLAVVIVPLVATTLYRALRKEFGKHRRIARRTLPLWLYVAVTGIVVYLMLYRLFPAA